MNEMIEFLTSKEIIVVYVIIAIAFFICFVIYLMDKSSEKRKRRQNTRKLNKLVEDVNKRMVEEDKKEEKKKKKIVLDDGSDRITKPNVSSYQNTPVYRPSTKFEEPEDSYLPPEIDFVPPIGEESEEVIPVSNINEELKSTPNVYDSDYYMRNYSNKKEEPVAYEAPTLTSSSAYDEFNTGYNYRSNVNNYIVDEVTSSFDKEMDAQINRVHEKIDKLVYTDPEPDREQATRELIKLTEELEKAERSQRQASSYDIYEDDYKPSSSRQGINIDQYESRQEEDAIISLDELNRKGDAMYASNELTQYADEGDEPITLADLERRKQSAYSSTGYYEEPKVETPVYEEPKKQSSTTGAYQERKKFGDELFSSVFPSGNTQSARTREEIEEELQKTSEFLISLKDLQSRLNS